MIVLDTNVVSELMRAEPAPVVLAWLRRQAAADGFDAQIAAVCRIHRVPALRPERQNFRGTGVEVADPWQTTVSA